MTSSQYLFEEYGPNSGYMRDLYQLYLTDPSLVGTDWISFFSNYSRNGEESSNTKDFTRSTLTSKNGTPNTSPSQPIVSSDLQSRVFNLVNNYRQRGHLIAKVNPLQATTIPVPPVDDLNIASYNFSSDELASQVDCAGFSGLKQMRLTDLVSALSNTYTGSLGFEHAYLESKVEREWVQNKIEQSYLKESKQVLPKVQTRRLQHLISAAAFEAELHKKYVGQKRFSLQGGETLIPMLNQVFDSAMQAGVEQVVLGMAHRGRLNVLRNIMNKPFTEIFSEFEDQSIFSVMGSGDVKYHMGYENFYTNPDSNKTLALALAPNPSHLEFVYPVVQGMVRAYRDFKYSGNNQKVLPIAIHGDAAVIGQGVVAETLNMAYVPGYSVGGTVHVVINNQVGFTTDPNDSRSSTYCTDFSKAIQALIIHVNCDDVDSACWATELALEFRSKFQRDVVLDLYCFRKYGHNEGDDPSFTQPVAYKEINQKQNSAEVYATQLVKSDNLTTADVERLYEDYANEFSNQHDKSKSRIPFGEVCATIGRLKSRPENTGTDKRVLQEIAQSLIQYSDNFTVHPKLHKILEKRVESLNQPGAIDWGFAEGLAFGCLMKDGVRVRLSGQDCGRGTFSQRHLALTDHNNGRKYVPYSTLEKSGYAPFEVVNSVLSETAVMAFEFGYSSVAQSDALVLWEGQFGDFANGAQVIIDQFLCSSEQKWNQMCGLVLLLPHGYEGQGPEHSSARLERYLQLCAEGNMVVAYPSRADQHFHLLRRQGLSEIVRPLVVMTPKSLLRANEASCSAEDLCTGKFNEILVNDFGTNQSQVVFCSGKVYYDIAKTINSAQINNVKVVRVEQLYPFPQGQIVQALQGLDLNKVIWVQEEPRNMGAWSYIAPFLEQSLKTKPIYIGRAVSASTATGSGKRHAAETQAFLSELVSTLR